MILKITELTVSDPYELDVRFNDGIQKRVDLRPLLWGPVFEPLLDPTYFARAMLDPRSGVVMWPNGADLAPEALHALPAVPAEGEEASRAVES
jgi:hypothetical protein